jgi:acetyl esterase/lipase
LYQVWKSRSLYQNQTTIMTLQYHREFTEAAAPLLETMARTTKLALGDISGRRAASAENFAMMSHNSTTADKISIETYHTMASDGFQIPIFKYTNLSRPGDQITSAVLYIHGGGIISGCVKWFENQIAQLADHSDVPIFAVEYRFAPEYPHPVPVHDCYAALRWLYSHASELNVNPTRIGVFGESAGGGIAAGLALLARDNKLNPPLAKQILIYPMLDDRNITPIASIEPKAVWTSVDNATGWSALLGSREGEESMDYYAVPARAECLAGLPSTYIDVGMLDIFRDEDISYASRLAQASVDTELHVYPGVPHAFELIAPDITPSKVAVLNRIRAMKGF